VIEQSHGHFLVKMIDRQQAPVHSRLLVASQGLRRPKTELPAPVETRWMTSRPPSTGCPLGFYQLTWENLEVIAQLMAQKIPNPSVLRCQAQQPLQQLVKTLSKKI
jgi:hypothetical protein